MSPVATEERPTQRAWTRTPAQQKLVNDHLRMVAEQYADADPEYVAVLKDETILGTPELMDLLGYRGGTRLFQLYSKSRELAEEDQVPHPSAVPEMDAEGGKRGARTIRGVMKGRAVLWAVQSTRWWWDSVNKRLVRQDEINHGGAPKRKA